MHSLPAIPAIKGQARANWLIKHAPMRHVAMDLFDAQGKSWLAMVCRYSGYAWLATIGRTSTKDILNCLEAWFFDFGWPEYIRSDGGTQFRTEFKQFCNRHGITHELSSPYNPESNGLAEAAVKNYKSLVLRCQANKDEQLLRGEI